MMMVVFGAREHEQIQEFIAQDEDTISIQFITSTLGGSQIMIFYEGLEGEE